MARLPGALLLLLAAMGPALGISLTESDLTRLSTAPTAEGSPSWASDHLLFHVADGALATVDLADSGPKTPREVDGKTWVFDPDPLAASAVRAYSGTLGRIESITEVAVSPDGATLAFISNHRSASPDLWLARADGSSARPLYAEPTAEAAPAWSADGRALWVASQGRLLRVDAETGGAKEVKAVGVSPPIEEYRDPAPGPDGTSLAFVARSAGEVAFDLWVMGTDGSNPRRLTRTAEAEAHPSWFPDGGRLAFQVDGTVSLIGADGTGLEPLRTRPPLGRVARPAVSPDGSAIAVVSDFAGSDDIWLLRLPGGGAPASSPAATAPPAAPSPAPESAPASAPTATPAQPGGGAALALLALFAAGLLLWRPRKT